jgi:hypothetical protein
MLREISLIRRSESARQHDSFIRSNERAAPARLNALPSKLLGNRFK